MITAIELSGTCVIYYIKNDGDGVRDGDEVSFFARPLNGKGKLVSINPSHIIDLRVPRV